MSSQKSVAKSLKLLGNVTMAHVKDINKSGGPQWLSAINIAAQAVQSDFPTVDGIQIAGAKAHQSHEVATHSNVISAKFFAENKRVISGHIHLNGTIDYSSRARSGGDAGPSSGSPGQSSSSEKSKEKSKSGGSDLAWRTNEQTNCAQWWDGTKWVQGDWSDEYQKWYAYYNGQWYYW